MQGQVHARSLPWILVTVILLADATILASTTWLLSARDQATAVSRDQVLENFRAELAAGSQAFQPPPPASPSPTPSAIPTAIPTATPTADSAPTSESASAGSPSSPATDRAPTPSPTPPQAPLGYRQPSPGVYEYATTGSESVSVMGAMRQYPSRTYASIQAGQGCSWRMELRIVAEHADEWQMCGDPGRLSRVGHTRTITWFGVTTAGYYDCGEGLLHDAPGLVVGRTHTYRGCTDGAGSIADIDVTLLERDTYPVGGQAVDAIAVEIVMHSSGTTRGLSTDRYWLAADTGMILHLERQVDTTSDTQLGVVDYREQATFTLTSMTPTT